MRTAPGVTPSEASRLLNCNFGTVMYHVRALVGEGRIDVTRERRTLRLHLKALSSPHAAAMAMLRGASAFTVACDVLAHPGTTVTQCVERTGLTARVAYYQSRRLVRAGLLLREPVQKLLYPAEGLSALLDEARPFATTDAVTES